MDSTIRELVRRAAEGDEQAAERLKRERQRAGLMEPGTIEIDGETFEVERIEQDWAPDGMCMIVTESGEEYYVAPDSETAGKAARAHWQEMAEEDPSEFRAIVGDEALVSWALGQPYAPGLQPVSSLSEWLDLWLDSPSEQWGSYDGSECEVDRAAPDVVDEIGFTPTVAYRHN